MAQVGDGDDAIGSVLVSQLQKVAPYQPKRLGTAWATRSANCSAHNLVP